MLSLAMLQLAVGLLHLTQGGLFNSPSTLYAVLVANSLSFSLINVTWSYVSFYQAHSKALEIRTRIAVFYVQIRYRKKTNTNALIYKTEIDPSIKKKSLVTKGIKGLPGAAEDKEPPANAGNVRGEHSSLGWEDPWRRK